MAATFDDTLTRDLDKIRADLGGAATLPLLTDEHVDAVLAWKGSHDAAVAYLAGELARSFYGKPKTIKVGDLALDYSDRVALWERLAHSAGSTGGLSFVAVTYGVAEADEYGRS